MLDINDYSTESKQIPWKPVAIVAGGFVMAVVIVIVVLRLLRGVGDSADLRAVVQDRCKNAQDQEACLQAQTQRTAKENGNLKLCSDLLGDAFDGCVWELALDRQDPELCKKLNSIENQEQCFVGIVDRLAVQKNDQLICDQIQDEVKRTACKDVVQGPVTAENCLSRGKEAKQCEMLAVAEEANKKQDIRVCDTLKDERVLFCKELVIKDDPDFDGLSSAEETIIYKTNPHKADSDNDGYADGDEVKAGYNPNGPGKLTSF